MAAEGEPGAPRGGTEIHIHGARVHNLRDVEVRIDRRHLTVITGVSGSGKSSLAFDTLHAEAYRKTVDALSPKARQFLDQLPRPDVDFIHGLSPVVAIAQHSGAGTNPRSTVASVTEIADYARLLWAAAGEARCPVDGGRVTRRGLDACLDAVMALPAGTRLLLVAPWLRARASVLREELPRLRQRGFQRVRLDGVVHPLDLEPELEGGKAEIAVDLVVDRLVAGPEQASRVADSLELAFREGRDRAIVLAEDSPRLAHLPRSVGDHRETPGFRMLLLARDLACETCGRTYEPLSASHFSTNHPNGACPGCAGLGQQLAFAPELVVPDPKKAVREGAIKPWRLGSKRMIIARNAVLKQLAEQVPFDAEAPWESLPEGIRELLLHGSGPRTFAFRIRARQKEPDVRPFEGVLADLDRTRRETSSDGLRARLHAYQVARPCPGCGGRRLAPYPAAVRLGGLGFGEFLARTAEDAAAFVRGIDVAALPAAAPGKDGPGPWAEVLAGLRERLGFLVEVGLGYLTLDREFATLSGGESQRVRLATQLGMGLVGVTYVLDEPSIGLHAADQRLLIRLLEGLRDRGNAVVVVEHDGDMMRAADRLIELGPGAGPQGGRVVFVGTPEECARAPGSLTGAYLSGRRRLGRAVALREVPEAPRLPLPARLGEGWLAVRGARAHNLRGVDVAFPTGLLTVVSGPSGSGKSTLVHDILGPAAAFRLNRAKAIPAAHDRVDGLEQFEGVVRMDQDGIGRSPRSNPASYVKLLDVLRDLFAQAPLARVRGYGPGRFSFNLPGGRCEVCQGDGAIALDMQFLGDVYTACPSCAGRRFNRETLEVRFKGLTIAEVLDLTVDEARGFFRAVPRVMEKLDTLASVGLGYLKLGQPANTLSGGEAQRLRLSLELSRRARGNTLYLLDEPTTGLHWADIQQLLDVLFRLRDAGHTVILIEHHLDVIRLADWIVDLGPGGGRAGGEVLYCGPREGFEEAAPRSPTARCLLASKG